MQKKHATSFCWILCVVGVFFVLTLLFFFAPATGAYKSVVRSLWYHRHPAPAYYLNRCDADLAVRIGSYYLGGGGYDLHRAEVSLIKAYKLDPKIHLAHYQLARVYFVEGKLDQAQQEINKELALDPYNERSFYIRGLIDVAQNNLPQAEADFKKFTLWAIAEWGGYNDLSFVLAKEDKYAESEAVLHIAFKRVPDAKSVPWLWNSLGLAQLNQLKYNEAAKSFQKALELARMLTLAQWQKAYSANDPTAAGESIKSFQQAIQKNLSTAQRGDSIEE